MVIFFLCLALAIVVLFIQSMKDNLSYGKNHSKSYGKEEESVSTLLDRTSWAIHYKGRVNLWYRFILMAVVISLLGLLVGNDGFPSPLQYFRTVFVVIVVLRAFHGYYTHHCDKFADYAINRNVGMIRKKLGFRKAKSLTPFPHKFRIDSDCYNFFYQTDL